MKRGSFWCSCAAVRNARKELVPSSSMVFQLSQTEDETAFNGCSGGGRAVLGGARAAVCGWERGPKKWSRSHGARQHAEGGRFAVRNRFGGQWRSGMGQTLNRKTEQEAKQTLVRLTRWCHAPLWRLSCFASLECLVPCTEPPERLEKGRASSQLPP